MIRRLSLAVRGKNSDGKEKSSKRQSAPPSGTKITINSKPQADGWPLNKEDDINEFDQIHGDATKFGKSGSEAVSGYPDPPDSGHNRVDIAKALDSLGYLVSENIGDGSHDKEDPHPSLFKELNTIGFGDMKTLKDKLELGNDPVDDKTMLVCVSPLKFSSQLTQAIDGTGYPTSRTST